MRFSHRATLAISTAAVVATTAVVVPVTTAGASSATSSHSRTTVSSTAASRPGTFVSHVYGTYRNGTVRGTFVPERSFVRNGKAFVQGNLNATVRRSDGTLVGRTSRHDVTLPVKGRGAHTQAAATAQRATCNVLHLVLGPLDLNLLGLKVHLNRVVLDITAQSGSGQLLGNLLCAVAHLLDGTSTLTQVLRLSSLLNRIIGLLT